MCTRALICLCPPPLGTTDCVRCGAEVLPEALRADGCVHCVCPDCGEASPDGEVCAGCADVRTADAA